MNKVQKRLIESRVSSKAKVARLKAAGWDFFYDPQRPSAPPTAPSAPADGPSPTEIAANRMAGSMVGAETNWRHRKAIRQGRMAQSSASSDTAPDEPTLVLGPGICNKLRPCRDRRPETALSMAQAAANPAGSAQASSLNAGGTRPPRFLRDDTDPSATFAEQRRRSKLNEMAEPALGKVKAKPARAITTPSSGLDILGRSDDQNI